MDKIPLHKLLIDIFLLLGLSGAFLGLKYLITPTKTGFYCNDYSVNLPFRHSTVNNIWLFIISFLVPCLFVIGTELGRGVYVCAKRRRSDNQPELLNTYRVQGVGGCILEVPEKVGNIIIVLMYFALGHLCTSIVTLIGKQCIGRLRPNFLDICKPEANPYVTYCNTHVTGKTYLVPDIDFKCLTSAYNPKEVDESRKSFPSGHSSSTFYGLVFLILYIHRVWSKRSLGFLPHFFQIASFGTAVFVALSRVQDHKHHPTDVLAGSVLGTLIAFVISYYVCLFFRRFNYKNKYELMPTNYVMSMETTTGARGLTASLDTCDRETNGNNNKSEDTNLPVNC